MKQLNKRILFPEAATLGRNIPKSKIYDNASINTKIKNAFINQIDKIVWSHKMSPDTVNVSASKSVEEFQVFNILLKDDDLLLDCVRVIDKAVPSPIIFEITSEMKVKYMASYKRRSEADSAKWVLSDYLTTDWINIDQEEVNLPVSLSIEQLYQNILKMLCPISSRDGESFRDLLERNDSLQAKIKEAMKIKTKIDKEKQFNRKVELNQSYMNLTIEIEALRKV